VKQTLGSNVIINDPVSYLIKRKKLVEGGVKKLQVLCDFDRTITKNFVSPGKVTASTYGVLESSDLLGSDFRTKTAALYTKYHPIELDPHIAQEEKVKMMMEWWNEAHDNLLKERLSKGKIPDIVRASAGTTIIREGALQLFDTLGRQSIPALIFSAGLGDIIVEILHQNNVALSDNLHVISNFLEFNDEDIASSFKGDVIHVFNKNEQAIKGTPYFGVIKDRDNVILVGDSLGDLGMSHGIQHDVVLNIGFLNDGIEKWLERYQKAFDVVILNEGKMDFVNELIQEIEGNSNT